MKTIKKWHAEMIGLVLIIVLLYMFVIFMRTDLSTFKAAFEGWGTPRFSSDNAMLIKLWFFRSFLLTIVIILTLGNVYSIIKEKRFKRHENERVE